MTYTLTEKTAEDRIAGAHYRIVREPEFASIAGLVMTGKWTVNDKVPTAKVNASGTRIYGRKFIDSLKPKEVAFIVLHETAHFVLLHLQRGKAMWEEDAQTANIAADHVANNFILECDPNGNVAVMPAQHPGYADPKYKGWTLRQVYDDLRKNGNGSGNNNKQAMDEHDRTLDEDDKDERSTEERLKEIEEQVETGLRTGGYLAGKLGGKLARGLQDLLEPVIDWRAQLAEFMMVACAGEDDATWRRPNRRFLHMDTYLPGTQSEAIGEVVICVDTSGSVGGRELAAMLSEVTSVCRTVKPSQVRLLYWSDGIESEELYPQDRLEELASSTKPVGGGGTVLHPVADYVRELKEPVQCAIILTDCGVYGSWGNWGDIPVLVVSTSDAMAPIGKTIKLKWQN